MLSGAVEHSDLAPNEKAQLVEAVRARRGVLKQALVAEASDRFRHQVAELINEIRALNGKMRALGGVLDESRWAVPSTGGEGG